jgi:hypothetical protein
MSKVTIVGTRADGKVFREEVDGDCETLDVKTFSMLFLAHRNRNSLFDLVL